MENLEADIPSASKVVFGEPSVFIYFYVPLIFKPTVGNVPYNMGEVSLFV